MADNIVFKPSNLRTEIFFLQCQLAVDHIGEACIGDDGKYDGKIKNGEVAAVLLMADHILHFAVDAEYP
jgi:hypothetical protein